MPTDRNDDFQRFSLQFADSPNTNKVCILMQQEQHTMKYLKVPPLPPVGSIERHVAGKINNSLHASFKRSSQDHEKAESDSDCREHEPLKPTISSPLWLVTHDDVMKWKHFSRYWPFVWGIHRSPVNSSHKGQWRGAWMFSLICAWTDRWIDNRDAGDFRRYRVHYDVTVMTFI